MAHIRLNKLSLIVASMIVASSTLSGCVTVRNYWQSYMGLDTSYREPTGYYEHLDTKVYRNNIVVPAGLDNPGSNPDLKLPAVDPNKLTGPLGAKVDVRTPIVPFRSDVGVHTQWSDNEALVWFDAKGETGIKTEDDAWMLLDKVLKNMNVAVGKIAQGQYVLTTIARDYNEYGQPYSESDDDLGLIRYNQIYQLRVGRAPNGELGIATRLLATKSSLSGGQSIDDEVDAISLQRFSMGFANNIIHELDQRTIQEIYNPDVLAVTIGEDKNHHQAMLVDAPFSTTFNLVGQILPEYGFEIKSYSVAKAEYDVEFTSKSEGFYERKGVDPIYLNSAKYKIRIGIEGTKSSITFYNDRDAPLKDEVVDIYPGFAQALINEYDVYGGATSPANVVKAE